MSTAQTLHLVDASMYVFRAWHSMPDEWHDDDGWPLNAVHGFARTLLELIERERPSHMVVAFDESLGQCFRNRIYPGYKANRPPAPEELRRQFGQCKALCEALGLVVLADGEYEADDLIGTALTQARAQGMRGVIVSADKDLSQLLGENDEQYDFARGERWTGAGVKARHGVHAHQLAEYLALCGDAVDNIPGVPGIGRKTAAVLLSHFRTLDAVIERREEIPFLRDRGARRAGLALREHHPHVRTWLQLTRIACDAPLDAAPPFARGPGHASLSSLCDRLRFGPLTRRRLQQAAAFQATLS